MKMKSKNIFIFTIDAVLGNGQIQFRKQSTRKRRNTEMCAYDENAVSREAANSEWAEVSGWGEIGGYAELPGWGELPKEDGQK